MRTFLVITTDVSGKRTERTMEAADRAALFKDLRALGEQLVSLSEVTPRMMFARRLFDRVSEEELILFFRSVGGMLQAGLPLARALAVMGREARTVPLRRAVERAEADISKGSSFAEALTRSAIFPATSVAMVRAGEEGGNLSQVLLLVADELEKGHELVRKVRGAMIYPAIIVSVMIGVGILMLVYVVPSLTSTFSELKIELPWSTKLLIGASAFLTENAILLLLGLVTFAAGFIFFARSPFGSRFLDAVVLRIPLVGALVVETNAARVSRTLSTLLTAGVSLSQGLTIVRDTVGNAYYKDALSVARERVERGEALSGVLNTYPKLFPSLVGEMASVGEETGSLPQSLSRLAQFYENDIDHKTKNLSVVIEPALMLLVGAAVAFFALSVLAPTYSLVNAV
ncbi:type II secretion system F family protein [Candidatus Parcubacteria bacterium]|nr:type II secretion system F family protein [Candidatus Parcubacteria bacterium]